MKRVLKITFVFKRYYTGKDVVLDRFGRLYEFPSQLARLGHQVTVICLDYRGIDDVADFIESFGAGSVSWVIVSFRSFYRFELGQVYRTIKGFCPDVIIGSSDIPCLWLSRKLSKCHRVPYLADLYDNYESFGQAHIPGFKQLLKTCINNAGAVITVSSALKSKVMEEYPFVGAVVVMNNGIPLSRFSPGSRTMAREALGLPDNVRLVGTAGSLSKMKGLDTVCEAWAKIEQLTEDVCLVLAGPIGSGFSIPEGERVIYLGELSECQVVKLFRALDVGIIPAHDSEFGRYCFPQKMYEMVACGLPIAGSKVGSIEVSLQANPEMLFEPGNADDLVAVLLRQLKRPVLADIQVMGWSEIVQDIEPVLLELV